MSSENLKISSTIHKIQSMRILKKGLGCGASHHFKYSFCKYFFLFTFSIHFIKEKLLFGVSSLLFNVQCTVFPLSCYSYVDIFPSQLYFLFLKNEKKNTSLLRSRSQSRGSRSTSWVGGGVVAMERKVSHSSECERGLSLCSGGLSSPWTLLTP